MAKSHQTFQKRQREQKRQQRKQEKEEKLTLRKNQKRDGNSLTDMMAYLDENGNIVDAPQG